MAEKKKTSNKVQKKATSTKNYDAKDMVTVTGTGVGTHLSKGKEYKMIYCNAAILIENNIVTLK